MDKFLPYLPELVFLTLHCLFFVIEVIRSRSLNKKITKICEECHLPVLDGEDHDCKLTSEQLQQLYTFVKSLRS